MSLFVKYNSVTNPVSVTPCEGGNIYNLFKAGYDETTIFVRFNYDIKKSVIVKEEFQQIEAEVLAKVSGQFLVETTETVEGPDGPYQVTDTTPFIVTTKQALIDSIASEILDPAVVVADVIAYDPEYSPARTWEDFVAYYQR